MVLYGVTNAAVSAEEDATESWSAELHELLDTAEIMRAEQLEIATTNMVAAKKRAKAARGRFDSSNYVDMLEHAQRRVKAMRSPAAFAPWLNPDHYFEIGRAGSLMPINWTQWTITGPPEYVVFQVIDESSCLVKISDDDRMFMVRELSTAGFTDGMILPEEVTSQFFRVTGTETYETAIGTKTVPLVKALGIDQATFIDAQKEYLKQLKRRR